MEMLTAAHGVRNLASLVKTKLNETPHDAPRSRGWRKFGGLSHTSCATWPCEERRSVGARQPYEQGWHFLCKGESPARCEGPSEAQESKWDSLGAEFSDSCCGKSCSRKGLQPQVIS